MLRHIISNFDPFSVHKSTPNSFLFIFSNFDEIWKKIRKMPISRPLVVLGQNSLGCDALMYEGSQPCPRGPGPIQCPFRDLVTPVKNDHLNSMLNLIPNIFSKNCFFAAYRIISFYAQKSPKIFLQCQVKPGTVQEIKALIFLLHFKVSISKGRNIRKKGLLCTHLQLDSKKLYKKACAHFRVHFCEYAYIRARASYSNYSLIGWARARKFSEREIGLWICATYAHTFAYGGKFREPIESKKILWKTYDRNTPFVSRFRFTSIVPTYKESIKTFQNKT